MLKNYQLKGFIYKTNDKFFDNLDFEFKFYLLGYFVASAYIPKLKKRNEIPYSEPYCISFCISIDDEDVIKIY